MTFKKWIENYWFYYKWHTLAGIVAVLFIVTAMVQCAQKVEPDLGIAYIGFEYVPTDVFAKDLSAIVGDINGDGKEYVFCDNVRISKEVKTDADFQMTQKIMLMFASGDTRLFIAEGDILKPFADSLMPLSGILPDDKFEDGIKFEGDTVAVKASMCPMLEKYSLTGDNLYVAILPETYDKKLQNQYEASIKLIKELAK